MTRSRGIDRLRRFRVAALLTVMMGLAAASWAQDTGATIYVFVQEGCPSCQEMKPVVERLGEELPDLRVEIIETMGNLENMRRLRAAAEKFDIAAIAVPAVFLGTHSWVGYSESITREIEAAALRCVEEGCIDALADPLPSERAAQTPEVSVGPFGTVSLSDVPLVLSTGLLAVLDGFNPCSLWVLTFLLGMVVHLRSRRKILLVGLVFLATTALIYGLFIVGIVQVVAFMSQMTWIRVVVILLALAMGVVNIKDYFAFKQGFSLTLSKEQQGAFSTRVRALLQKGDRLLPLVTGTAVLAAGIAIIELPCTAGFPVIWSNMVSTAGVGATGFAALLGLYLTLYLLDELIVVAGVTFALKRMTITEKGGRFLKLLGGLVMIVLGGVLAIAPDLMESLPGVAAVFGGAVLVALLVAWINGLLQRPKSNSELSTHEEE